MFGFVGMIMFIFMLCLVVGVWGFCALSGYLMFYVWIYARYLVHSECYQGKCAMRLHCWVTYQCHLLTALPEIDLLSYLKLIC